MTNADPGDLDDLGDWVTDSADDEAIGEAVARMRKASGLSQEALVERMRESGWSTWHQTTISRIERGKRGLNFAEIRSLESILGLGLLKETRTSEALGAIADRVITAGTARRLRDADEALTQTLSSIRELRRIHDRAYRERKEQPGDE